MCWYMHYLCTRHVKVPPTRSTLRELLDLQLEKDSPRSCKTMVEDAKASDVVRGGLFAAASREERKPWSKPAGDPSTHFDRHWIVHPWLGRFGKLFLGCGELAEGWGVGVVAASLDAALVCISSRVFGRMDIIVVYRCCSTGCSSAGPISKLASRMIGPQSAMLPILQKKGTKRGQS